MSSRLVLIYCFLGLVLEQNTTTLKHPSRTSLIRRAWHLRGGADDEETNSPFEFKYVQVPKTKKRYRDEESSSGLSELLKDTRPEDIRDIDNERVEQLLRRHNLSSKTERRKEKRKRMKEDTTSLYERGRWDVRKRTGEHWVEAQGMSWRQIHEKVQNERKQSSGQHEEVTSRRDMEKEIRKNAGNGIKDAAVSKALKEIEDASDFDEEKHQRLMEIMYGAQYYNETDSVSSHPFKDEVFSDDSKEIQQLRWGNVSGQDPNDEEQFSNSIFECEICLKQFHSEDIAVKHEKKCRSRNANASKINGIENQKFDTFGKDDEIDAIISNGEKRKGDNGSPLQIPIPDSLKKKMSDLINEFPKGIVAATVMTHWKEKYDEVCPWSELGFQRFGAFLKQLNGTSLLLHRKDVNDDFLVLPFTEIAANSLQDSLFQLKKKKSSREIRVEDYYLGEQDRLEIENEFPETDERFAHPLESKKRMEEEITDLRKRAKRGDAEACYTLGTYYVLGEVIPKDAKVARKYFQDAVDLDCNHGKALNDLACSITQTSNNEADLKLALHYLRRSVDTGCIFAMHNLACMFHDGVACVQDFSKAFELHVSAANAGVRDSSFEVGRFYKEGIGVEANTEMAVKYFKDAMDAATEDDLNACSAWELAKIYIQGNYKPSLESKKEGISFLELACKQKHPAACFMLGNLYLQGNLVPRSKKQGIQYLKIAAHGGHKEAHQHLRKLQR